MGFGGSGALFGGLGAVGLMVGAELLPASEEERHGQQYREPGDSVFLTEQGEFVEHFSLPAKGFRGILLVWIFALNLPVTGPMRTAA